MSKNLSNQVLQNPIHLFSFGLGSGLLPVAPGTMGTLLAVPIYILMSSLPIVQYLILVAILFIAGWWSSAYTSRALKQHDHPGIVIDEIVGFLITMVWVPYTWYWVLLGFVLFRLFDIWKPWPVSFADQAVKGGLGIMLDDLVAGIYALLSLHIVIWSAQFI